ncbi:MAG TPA: tRNA (adenosine(37)-N6)-threonylcarbamoyltransferase complex dimerization subunit type 1 TsaB [Anaerolineae bacterium]|nr:tRNA (adenosine(37)-N6)-threonylcarbamoyltransferase complex dimerization subunit type 1 TsaB [Anaerolineae bacterium]
MLLAIDTATRTATIALYDQEGGRVPAEESWSCSENHTVELMPRLVRMMEQQGVPVQGLTGVVVSLGPGSFTGLRAGLGVAKGLVVANQTPLVGVPTLEVVARPHMGQVLPIWAVCQAGRGRICAAHHVRRRGRWLQLGDYYLVTWGQLCTEVERPALLCGEIDSRDADSIRDQLGPDVTIASPAASLRRAAYLAEAGWERLSRGDSDDPATLTPIYLQQPKIDE